MVILTSTTATTTTTSTTPTAPRGGGVFSESSDHCHMTHFASSGMRVTIPTLAKFRFGALLRDACVSGLVTHHFTATTPFATMPLSAGGRRIMDLPNAGGNSVASEVMSFELLRVMFNAQLSRTEMELEYFPHGSKITDFSITVAGEPIGVSVTRAMKFRGTFTTLDGVALLSKKLYGVTASTAAVVQETWKKQILHVFAEQAYVADELRRAFDSLDPELRANTLVLVTVVENARWIFTSYV